MDRQVRQFLELVEESSAPLLNNGFVKSAEQTLGAVGHRPYSVRVVFTREDLEVASQLVLEFAGEENLTSIARRGGDLVFEASATAHKGQEMRKALTQHFESALPALEVE